MAVTQRSRSGQTRRKLLARPLDALVFLLPLIFFCEAVAFSHPQRVIAFDITRRFFGLFGSAGTWAPGLVVIAILVATHFASREKWSVHWRRVGLMYAEAVVLALPLILLNWAIPLAGMLDQVHLWDRLSSRAAVSPLLDRIALGVGAGIYEELLFRLMMISLVVMVGADLLKLDATRVTFAAISLSSLAFAAHHHQPIGSEPFDLIPFTFRTIAGVYLAIIFWYRGYGPVAGCHAAYNVALVCLGANA